MDRCHSGIADSSLTGGTYEGHIPAFPVFICEPSQYRQQMNTVSHAHSRITVLLTRDKDQLFTILKRDFFRCLEIVQCIKRPVGSTTVTGHI
jgi:hypothetical protein